MNDKEVRVRHNVERSELFVKKRPKVGLALGSGAARGLAHFGVLKVFQQEGIPIDYIAGSSMGSLIGVLFANDLDLEMCEKLAVRLKRKHWLDLTVPKHGFIIGDKVKELVRLLTHQKQIEELSIPTAIVATDLVKGERVIFRSGPVDEAVRASIAIPGVFEPVFRGDQILVDGGVIDRVPIHVVREMGADIVVAVDVIAQYSEVQVESIFDVITYSLHIMEREILSSQILTADVLLCPQMSDISPTAFHRVEESIQRGEDEARKHIHKIKELIEKESGKEARNAFK